MKSSVLMMLSVFILFTNSSWTDAQNIQASQFISCDEQFSIEYPADWEVMEKATHWRMSRPDKKYTNISSEIVLANSDDALRKRELELGDYRLHIYQEPVSEGLYDSPSEMLKLRKASSIQYTQVVELTNLSMPAAMWYFSDEHRLGIEAVIFTPDFNLLIIAEMIPDGDLTDLENMTLDVIESIEVLSFSTPLNKLIYFENGCDVKLYYPTTWIFSNYGGRIFLFNSLEAQDARVSRQLYGDDELGIEIITPDKISGYFYNEFDPLNASAEEIFNEILALNGFILSDDIEPIQIGNYTGIGGDIGDGWVVVINHDLQHSVIIVRGGSDALFQAKDDIFEIVSSLKVSVE